jgi:hypothetical protein
MNSALLDISLSSLERSSEELEPQLLLALDERHATGNLL